MENSKKLCPDGIRLQDIFAVSALIACAIADPALAVQSGVAFGGTVALRQVCQIIVSTPEGGTLAASPDLVELSSRQVGGDPGTAEVRATNAAFSISIDSPAGFTSMPVGGDTGVTLSSTYSGAGATVFADQPGTTAVNMKKGLTIVSTHFIASRVGDTFPEGSYAGELTLRCE